MNFTRFWKQVVMQTRQDDALLRKLCEDAWNTGFEQGFEAGHEEGWAEGDDHGYFDRQTELRLVK